MALNKRSVSKVNCHEGKKPDHSLSRLLHGLRPVANSRTTQPIDQISIAPWRPRLSFLMTSGDMYMGVPVRLLLAIPGILLGCPTRDRWIVRWLFARTFAAPKSTNLMTPIWSSKISVAQLSIKYSEQRNDLLSGLMSLWIIPLEWRYAKPSNICMVYT